MAKAGKRAWWTLTPIELGMVAGIGAFICTMVIPASYVARYSGKHPSARRDALTPEERSYLRELSRDWTEERVLPKACGFGLAFGVVAATSGVIARSLKRRHGKPSKAKQSPATWSDTPRQ